MSLDISDVPEVVQHLAFPVEKGMAGYMQEKLDEGLLTLSKDQ
jgi:hypothetical protein